MCFSRADPLRPARQTQLVLPVVSISLAGGSERTRPTDSRFRRVPRDPPYRPLAGGAQGRALRVLLGGVGRVLWTRHHDVGAIKSRSVFRVGSSEPGGSASAVASGSPPRSS